MKTFWDIVEDRLDELPEISIRAMERHMNYSHGTIYKRLQRKADGLPSSTIFRLFCLDLKLDPEAVLRELGYLPQNAEKGLTADESVLVS